MDERKKNKYTNDFLDISVESEEVCPLWEEGSRHPIISVRPPISNLYDQDPMSKTFEPKWTCVIKCAPTDMIKGAFKCPACSGKFPDLEKQMLELWLKHQYEFKEEK